MSIVREYIDFKREVQMKSDKTIKAYESDLKEIIPIIFGCIPDCLEVDQIRSIKPKFAIDCFSDMLRSKAPTTVNRRLACFKDFYKYCSNCYGFANIMGNLSKLNDTRVKTVECIDKDMSDKTIELAKDHSPRDYYILSMLYGLGIRATELLTITREMIFDDFVIIVGKNNKMRKVQMNDKTKQAVNEFLRTRGNHEGLMLDLSYQGLRKMFTKYNKLVGVDCSKIHSTRHSTASNLLKNGATIETVSAFLGHSNLDITMKFYINNEEAQKIAVETL